MTRTIDFYFDFISPFSYLAQLKLPEIARAAGCEVDYWPIDIPEAKIAAGNYGPSNREVLPKIKVMKADLERWAERYGVPLNFPASFDCAHWNCAVLYARKHGRAEQFVTDAYRRIWGQGIDPRDRGELAACATAAGLDAAIQGVALAFGVPATFVSTSAAALSVHAGTCETWGCRWLAVPPNEHFSRFV